MSNKNNQRFYCYKVKHAYIKIREDNAYVHAKIEDFGFKPIFVSDSEDEESYWAEGWAKNIKLKHNSGIGSWIKANIEHIYAAEHEKEDSKWIKEILDSGYEFDEGGMLIDNEKAVEDIDAQLCVMATGDLKGTLFINVGGAMEVYNSETILKDAGEYMLDLIADGIVYLKRLKL